MISNFKNQTHQTHHTSNIVSDFYRQMRNLARGCRDKDELTDEEKFALCFMANVGTEIKASETPNMVTWKTIKKCAVVKLDGQWTVIVDDLQHVE